MKKKSGFTLVEVIAVVVIISILSMLVAPSVFSVTRKAKQDSYNVLIDSFEENARLYVNRHREEVENSLDTSNSYTLTLKNLKDDNLLKTPINDPRTDEVVDLNKTIIVTRETDNTLSICFVDRGCYAPTLLVNELTKEGNVVSGTTEGLHYEATNDFYYFRGSNPKNWIEFNGLLWRIVKINTDNSVKIIYEGTRNPSGTNENGNVVSRTFDDANVNNYNTAVSIRTYLENWYNTNILNANKSKVQSKNWCIGKVSYNVNGTSKGTFLSTECSAQTTSSIPIGLITGSEYLYASLDVNCLTAYKTSVDYGYTCKNSNYLYKNNYSYWTILGDSTATNIWNVNQTGSLGAPVAANTTSAVRPVINITTGVYIDSGDGTFDKPYKIKDIVNVDKEKPVITMLGDSTVTIKQGNSYSDAGATANDNVDGDITSKIITISNVNINVQGTYTVTYTVSDNSGNKRSASRIVKVIENSILASGMIPVYYDEATWLWKKADILNPSNQWFDYDNQKWANAVTVTTATRATYQGAAVGTTVNMSDINAMFVWIPRFKYMIPAGTGAREILVSFEAKDAPKSVGDAVSTYYTHPAFTLGTTELSGLWVGKFETTGTITAPTILPDVTSLRIQSVKAMFDGVKTYMQGNATFGFTDDNDIHMMKNIEWGAVALLSGSKYGKYGNTNYIGTNKELFKNNSSSFITGRSMGTPGGTGALTYTYEYITEGYYTYDGKCASIHANLPVPCNSGSTGQALTDKTLAYGASTTGTIYGIYDMSGGAYDYVMGVYEPNPIPATGIADFSGYSSTTTDSQYNLLTINNKYYDRYLTDSATTGAILGDATKETSGWYDDQANFVNFGHPWFVRGGYCCIGVDSGAWYSGYTSGGAGSGLSFRVVLGPQA